MKVEGTQRIELSLTKVKRSMFIENRIKRKESINEQIIEKNVIIEIMQVFP